MGTEILRSPLTQLHIPRPLPQGKEGGHSANEDANYLRGAEYLPFPLPCKSVNLALLMEIKKNQSKNQSNFPPYCVPFNHDLPRPPRPKRNYFNQLQLLKESV